MELAVGRASRKSAVLSYKTLEKPKSKWHIHGWFCLIGCYLLMMYYTTVSGWMVSYFGRFAFGSFRGGMATEEVSAVFGQMLSSPTEMGVLAVAVVIVGFLVCSFGLEKGLERVTKVMMLALLAIMIVLAVNSFFMPGGEAGLAFYLMPDAEAVEKIGIGNLVVNAMNQAFFTLSIGAGGMLIFGSYLGKDRSLPGEAVRIAKAEMPEANKRMEALRAQCVQTLTGTVPDIVFLGGGSAHILSLSLPGYRSEVLMNYLEAKGIYVSKSSACKRGKRSHVLEAIGAPDKVIDGALRVSFSRYTTAEECAYFCEALAAARKELYPSL